MLHSFVSQRSAKIISGAVIVAVLVSSGMGTVFANVTTSGNASKNVSKNASENVSGSTSEKSDKSSLKTSGKTSSYDEAYYVTTDYYGNITDGSIVKSYTLNGQKEIRDKGKYDKITNLSDGKEPDYENGEYIFRFDDNLHKHFYYECTTKEPFSKLPWDISISYKLNGVRVDAEDLPGQKGIIEIDIDAILNENADEYALNNYTLETAAIFNKDDIDSLEAEGAQIQLLGNLKTVLFAALPGEEQHVNIKVGTDSFNFGGLTFLLVPATLGQFSEFSKLADDKETLEENYNKLSLRLDDTIEMIDDMGDDLGQTAEDLSQVAADAGKLAGSINPLVQDLDTTKKAIDDSVDAADPLLKELVSLKADLISLGDVISSIQSDMGDADEKLEYLNDVRNDLEDASDELVEIENDVTSIDLETDAPKAYALYGAYLQNFASSGVSFTQALPLILKPTVKAEVEAAVRPQVLTQVTAQVKSATKQQLIGMGMPEAQAEAQAEAYINSAEGKALIESQTTAYMNTNPECVQLIENNTTAIVNSLVNQYAPKETQIKHLYNLYKTNIASLSDASYDELAIVNEQLKNIVEGVSAPESLLNDMGTLIGDVKNYRNLIDDMNSLGTVTKDAVVDKGQVILDEIDVIDGIINYYRPSADDLLKHVTDASKELTNTTEDTEELLENLSEGLRNTSNHIIDGESLQGIKDDVTEIIEDTWNEYTGEKNRLLLMDPNATPVSLTSAENPSPETIQVVIRTQEINEDADDRKESASNSSDSVTEITASSDNANENTATANVFTRIVDMFKDMWHSITGIFVRRDE